MSGLIKDFFGLVKTFGIIDFIDILVVAFIVYYAIILTRETRAMQLVKSIGVILLVYFVATTLHMATLEFLLKTVLDIGIIVLVVLFQPEIRRALEKIGRSNFSGFGKRNTSLLAQDEINHMVSEICLACDGIIKRKEGALIVLEQKIKLGDIIATGTEVDGKLSSLLLSNLFFHNSPLHDGAVIVRDYRVSAAGCFLPLSESSYIAQEMGTRHRAAVGISEVSDAIVIIVSEERGVVSIAQEGNIITPLSTKELGAQLRKILIIEEDDEKKNFWKFGERKNETRKEKSDRK